MKWLTEKETPDIKKTERKRSFSMAVKLTGLSSLLVSISIFIQIIIGLKFYNIAGAQSGQFILITMTAAFILLLFSILVNFSVTKLLIMKPIGKIINALKQSEAGNLSQKLYLPAGDELGEIAGHFDKTFESLKRMVMIVQNEVEAVDDIGIDLFSNMNRVTIAIGEIKDGIQNIQNQVSIQKDSVNTTNTAMRHITKNIECLTKDVEIQNENVEQSSASIEEMLANIESVTRTIRLNSENVANLANASELGRTGLSAVAEDMNEIVRESEELLEINSVLQSIAGQTNLLSMNAAIESAHAGAAGKGFAVVAEEIGKLAKSSREQSNTIKSVLKRIKDFMERISAATSEVLGKFNAIDDGLKIVSDQEMLIHKAMEEQTAGSRQILEAIKKLKETSRTVKNNSDEMREESKLVVTEAKNLDKISSEITSGINEITARAAEVNSSVNHVNLISQKSKSNIDILKEAISHFIITDKHYRWDDSYCIGVKKIDEQHMQLFDTVNKLLDAIEAGTGKEELKKSLDFLASYTVGHFADEEELQRSYDFPDYDRHKRIHEKFTKTALDLIAQFESFGSSEALVKEVKRKVGDWLVSHVRGQDSKIGIHIGRLKSGKLLVRYNSINSAAA